MKRSDSFQKLMSALGAFQAEGIKITKDSTNPHFKSRYASLTGILDTIQPLLTKHSLSYTQLPEGGKLTTILMHTETGEWIETEYDLTPSNNTPQGIGSAITYARRYSLTATLGLNIDEDDDGNAASEQGKSGKQQPQQVPPAAQSVPSAPISPFNRNYNGNAPAIKATLAVAANKEEIVALYNANRGTVDSDTELQASFKKRKQEATQPQEPKAADNSGKFMIKDAQFAKVIERLNEGELQVYEQALNVYILSESQKASLKAAYQVNEQISRNGLSEEEIVTALDYCVTEAQVLRIHKNNSMICDRSQSIMHKINSRIKAIKGQAA